MIKLTVIFLNGEISNVYVNSGYYPHKIANEMREKGYGKVDVVEYDSKISQKEFQEFIEKNSKRVK